MDSSERYKDANECLQAGVEAERMRLALVRSREFAPEKVRSATDFVRELEEEWFGGEEAEGLLLPFGFPDFRIRRGELTVWTGIEKSGKTTLLDFVLCALMAQGERVFDASLETKVPKTLKKFSRQLWGGLIRDRRKEEELTDEAARAAYWAECRARLAKVQEWWADRLWVYQHTGICHWRQLAEDMRWTRRRLGVTQFKVDNFMRLGIAKDDYAQQADAITYFANLAMELDAHIHMVVHQNKSEGVKGGGLGKRSVAGAFEIIANAHNIVEVIRDVTKGEKMGELFDQRRNGMIDEEEFQKKLEKLSAQPDGQFRLHAQREGEVQNGSKYLWFLWESQQYCDVGPKHPEHRVIRYVEAYPRRREEAGVPDLD